MFHLTVRDHVMIAHSLPHPSFGPAQNLHGATYVVELTLWRETLSPESIVIDIGEAADVLSSALSDLNYRNLDEHPDLAGTLTTTEAVARLIAERVASSLADRDLSRLDVTLREHPDAWAGYSVTLE
ncbi:MAG TPA: 6-carboxytetrahydropterin synthase [Propionibacteriaceae bacterium]|jgi:6-pyruvoyltetrahydropterin/6-carboxytetrahydropterin synthase|nr:6-carboxytetrahydropterin synthase [Propionibacteriaceae bacterium]